MNRPMFDSGHRFGRQPTRARMYGFTTNLADVSFAQALAKVIDALKAEGFGALSDIDVQQVMKVKLGVTMPPYRNR